MDFVKKPSEVKVNSVDNDNPKTDESRPLSISTSRKIATPTTQTKTQLKSPKSTNTGDISSKTIVPEVLKSPLKSDIKSPIASTGDLMRLSPTIGQMILRKPSSVSFYIDLMDMDYRPSQYKVDEADDSVTTPRSPTKMPSIAKLQLPNSPQSSIPQAIMINSPIKQAVPLQPPTVPPRPKIYTKAIPSFPKINFSKHRMTGKELASVLDKKMQLAHQNRSNSITERKQKLARQAQSIKFRVMIHESRMRLERLRLEAKAEYNSSTAMLNRQIHLRKVREKFGSKVEHAKRVMLLQKMKKYVEMRRALSENFVDLLRVDESAEFPTESDARMTPLGLSVTLDERELDSESSDDDDHFHQPNFSIPQSSPISSPTERTEYIFAQSPKSRSESLSDQIRRTKSLPDLVLQTSDDSTFLDLLNLLPPITRFNLRELEMDEILSNSQLRHDLIFDSDLKFKATDADDPVSQQKTQEYWSEIKSEVDNRDFYRLPLLLSEIRAILVELLPSGQDQKEEIFGMIDTHLISQQIMHGIMNPKGLIDYIASVMKTNCAPIRDVIVDRMVQECQDGKLAECLQTCFEVLELMKLDYANHQMTKLRPYIVQHGVEFEWKLFRNQLEAGLTRVTITKSWLKRAWEAYKQTDQSPNPAYDLFPEAFMQLVSYAPRFSDDDVLPETWKMDTTRLVTFYNSWQDITILATILIVFRQISGPKCQNDNVLEAKKGLWILLNDSDSTMSHITLQMASLASKIRGFAMSVKETSDLNTMVEKTLAPGSKLYELVQKRVGVHLENGLHHRKVDADLLIKHGLTALRDEIEDLIAKIVPVADMNRAVYGNLYAGLLEDIKAELE